MMNFSRRNAQQKRRKRIRTAVADHRAALAQRGLARVETFVDREIAAELRARALAAGVTLRTCIAQILTAAIRG